MKIRVIIAVLLIGALLCSGIVVAEKPAKETIRVTKFIHYKDTSDNVKEKTLPEASTTNQGRVKTPKPTSTPTPTPDSIDSDNSTSSTTPAPTATTTPEPTRTASPTPTETTAPEPTTTSTPEPTETAIPDPTETVAPTPSATATPEPTEATPEPTATVTTSPTATATPKPTVTVTASPTATATPVPSDLYKLKGIKWNQFPVTFYVDPSGSGLNADAVRGEVMAALGAWDAEVGVDLVEYGGAVAGNGRNDVVWTSITDTRIIGVTTLTSTSSGIIEADIRLNSLLPWGIDADGEGTQYILTDRFDVRNIVTHEAGHSFGLADLYDSSTSDLTMYGYSSRGQTKKISLGNGDILGIQALYGA